MKSRFILIVLAMVSTLFAGDFNWMSALDSRYESNPTNLRTNLNERFNVGDSIISNVVKSVAKPSDAYMVLKLAEMSGLTSDAVLKKYQTSKDKGWGVMAQNLGIKPGSAEFKALKAGHDMDRGSKDSNDKGNTKEKKNGKDDHDKDKGKGKKAD